MTAWTSPPDVAWREHILPDRSDPRWIEDNDKISREIWINKRELFGLIILAHWYNKDSGNWAVGYDESDVEPNDGYITNGASKVRIEHKVITQMEDKEVLEAILSTYEKTAKKGSEYGKDRVLVIQPNKGSDHGGLIKISDLTEKIGDQSPFEKVLTLQMTAKHGHTGAMHILQHYPRYPGSNLAQVDFDFWTGNATVPFSGIEPTP